MRAQATIRRPLPGTIAWGIIALLLAFLWRFSSLGMHAVPTSIEIDNTRPAAVRLVRAPQSPHRILKATCNGRVGWFLLDTGTASSVISSHFVQDAGADTRSVLAGINDRFGWHRVLEVSELAMGNRAYRDFEIQVVDLSQVQAGLQRPIEGILGMDILLLQPAALDLAANKLSLGAEPSSSETTAKEMDCMSGVCMVEVAVGGDDVPFIIDTGASPTTLSAIPKGARRLRSEGMVRVDATTVAPDAESFIVPEISFAGLVREQLEVVIGEYNVLGVDFFDGSVLILDGAAGRILVDGPPT